MASCTSTAKWTTRGGDYSPESGAGDFDFQMPYLKAILGLIGLTDVNFIVAQPLDMTTPEHSAEVLQAAIAAAREAGNRF